MRAFFVGFQRVTAIRTGASGLIPATRSLMGGNTISHLVLGGRFPAGKSPFHAAEDGGYDFPKDILSRPTLILYTPAAVLAEAETSV